MITPLIVACLAAGDLSVWNVFYDDYAPLLYGIIRRQVSDDRADAVLENSLLSIYHRIHEFEPGNQLFFTWMVRITNEVCSLVKASELNVLPITLDFTEPDASEVALG